MPSDVVFGTQPQPTPKPNKVKQTWIWKQTICNIHAYSQRHEMRRSPAAVYAWGHEVYRKEALGHQQT